MSDCKEGGTGVKSKKKEGRGQERQGIYNEFEDNEGETWITTLNGKLELEHLFYWGTAGQER